MGQQVISQNTLFYGDNLTILREYIADESIDLVYLDPPFNSNRTYNVLFKDESGEDSEAQITAFEDTWHWNHIAQKTYNELVTQAPDHVSKLMAAMYDFIGASEMMAYVAMMTIRLVELHRVLKTTGSIYLHCDPTASHYMKIVLDTIFGPQNFRNEIIWKRSQPKAHVSMRFSRAHDVILIFAKSPSATFHLQHTEHDPEYVEKFYRYREPDTGRRYRLGDLTNLNKDRPNLTYEFPPGSGTVRVWRWTKDRMQKAWAEGRVIMPEKGKVVAYKRYLDEMEGAPVTDVWDDIEHLHGTQQESLGYPTQKPLSLLERIINTSSNAGDIVLDSFCGCGTAIAAAQKLGRKWVGIDITHLSIALQKYRLEAMFPGIRFIVRGEPSDYSVAKKLAQEDRYQFQWWALSLVRAKPLGGQEGSKTGKQGSDKGIDGVIGFLDDNSSKPKRVIVQVKSGHVKAGDIRDLAGTLAREKAAIGVFITLEPPTRDMLTEALSSGYYHSVGWNKDYPKIQILTIAELLHSGEIKMPPQYATFKQPRKVDQEEAVQTDLFSLLQAD